MHIIQRRQRMPANINGYGLCDDDGNNTCEDCELVGNNGWNFGMITMGLN